MGEGDLVDSQHTQHVESMLVYRLSNVETTLIQRLVSVGLLVVCIPAQPRRWFRVGVVPIKSLALGTRRVF